MFNKVKKRISSFDQRSSGKTLPYSASGLELKIFYKLPERLL